MNNGFYVTGSVSLEHKEKIQHELESTLKKYEDQNVKDVLSEIRNNLQSLFNNFISSEEGLYVQDFPIEFENNLGRWKIMGTGECFVQPKVSLDRINLDITIKPS